MFKERILDRTKKIARERGYAKVMMASKEALKEVMDGLSEREVLSVGLELKAWNSGHIRSEPEKRR